MLNRLAVIVGCGEITDRPTDLSQSLEPLALMATAIRRACDDGRCGVEAIDSIDIVHQVSWRYENTARRLCERLNIQPARAVYGVTGGESPVRYIHEAALRIARGESNVAVICGGESQYAVNKAKSMNVDLPWTLIAQEIENPFSTEGRLNPIAIAHGAIRPIHVYPFYENASHLEWQQSPRAALAESCELWSRYSQVAATNPYSWSRTAFTPEQIATPSPDNRLICYPYTKRMVANPAVNQGAAVLLMSLERARSLHIDESQLLFVIGGAAAMEPRDYLARDQYAHSDAQDVVLGAMRELSEANDLTLDATELYSCFPCVPKMTRRVLQLPPHITPTVTGGLSFFGAPLNNYMTHAACAMIRHLRSSSDVTGLLYGQGEFITKHHALLVSREPPRHALPEKYSVQAAVDKRRGAIPRLVNEYRGEVTIETHSVVYDRDGTALHGTVISRTPDDARVMARVPGADIDGIKVLTDAERSPIGLRAAVSDGDDGLLRLSI